MKLFHRHIGNGWPIVIVHGLYGSSDNWLTIAKKLADHFSVYLVDVRNHGNSPHSDIHSYDAIAEDLREFLETNNIRKPIVIGHSMGGKAVMQLGLLHPELIHKLVVVDISPTSNLQGQKSTIAINHHNIISAMRSLPLHEIESRREADTLLSERVPAERERSFLLKNLTRDSNGFRWKLNLDVLARQIDVIMGGLSAEDASSTGQKAFPVLFIKGENSGYINTEDEGSIKIFYPDSQLITIANAGHWVHAEAPEAFTAAVMSFCSDEADFF